VRKQAETYYIVDFPRLVRLVVEGKSWKDIGVSQLYGRISIFTTDPTKSSSGNLFAGLLANVLNGGEVVDEASLPKVQPTLKKFFARLGFLEQSSEDLFQRYLTMGMGDKPIIAGYESQLVEFSLANPQYQDLIRKRVRILYPIPTVWSSHPLIAVNDKGLRLLQGLQDPAMQRLAWERHGFRSGLVGAQNDPKVLKVVGIPETIQNVIPLPTPRVMDKIITGLSSQ
jgi:hypothetical protein